ncbi:uncharacterized protein LOC109707980 [Ananas comosus]|uniref:Uncharacterized protein LOC109707980 n=1 Tax=Ananas comosus TaxID=4615 RepID=A0A6P5EN99_ANACO|nr:uncharacterized protein LOC109707980 [Ananas comosus]XP_020085125.1 uncharacterized protein LOC109707980 [Ananas comosus]XP_020085126.1 uncharacterized protein LOC109707980 [Ananas comosus]XP_020085127.1 uncharacterized protein LOC109707980 [Ananas comosus]
MRSPTSIVPSTQTISTFPRSEHESVDEASSNEMDQRVPVTFKLALNRRIRAKIDDKFNLPEENELRSNCYPIHLHSSDTFNYPQLQIIDKVRSLQFSPILLEEEVEEAHNLSTIIKDLELQLSKEQEEYKKNDSGSKIVEDLLTQPM